MRNEFTKAIIKHAVTNKHILFLTGDLGFMAFEELKEIIDDRFVNMGVSEQNMMSVAASMAMEGFIPFTYSIAPFAIARPYEQIRNEIGLHNLPVKIVANGGGFGYGIMGSTHHILEDFALMRSIQNMKLYIPTYLDDVGEAVALMAVDPSPNYLRLNSSIRREDDTEAFSYYRRVRQGTQAVLIGAGPVMHHFISANDQLDLQLDIWLCDQLPLTTMPKQLIESINRTKHVLIAEEHYEAGGLGEAITVHLHKNHIQEMNSPINFHFFNIKGYLSGNYGDQRWHLEENKLAGNSLHHELEKIVNK